MIEVEQNYKFVISEEPYVPDMTPFQAKNVGATNIRRVFVYLSVEYDDYSFIIRASHHECILKEACGKVLSSDMLDEVEHEWFFTIDDNGRPLKFAVDEINSRVDIFVSYHSKEYKWLEPLKVIFK